MIWRTLCVSTTGLRQPFELGAVGRDRDNHHPRNRRRNRGGVEQGACVPVCGVCAVCLVTHAPSVALADTVYTYALDRSQPDPWRWCLSVVMLWYWLSRLSALRSKHPNQHGCQVLSSLFLVALPHANRTEWCMLVLRHPMPPPCYDAHGTSTVTFAQHPARDDHAAPPPTTHQTKIYNPVFPSNTEE